MLLIWHISASLCPKNHHLNCLRLLETSGSLRQVCTIKEFTHDNLWAGGCFWVTVVNHDATLGQLLPQRGSERPKLWTWSAAFPFCRSSQDNWDDEDEDEEKKAEVTKTGTAGKLPTDSRRRSGLVFRTIEVFYFTFQSPKSLKRRS